MSSPHSDLRILGAAAALGGLILMMCAPQPSLVSLGWGIAGLLIFGLSRLVPMRSEKPEPVLRPGEANGLSTNSAGTTPGAELTDPIDATPAGLHAALERRMRVSRPANPSTRSSVLPPSRALRSPSAKSNLS